MMLKHYTDLASTEYLALQLHQRDLGKACKDVTHYKEVITPANDPSGHHTTFTQGQGAKVLRETKSYTKTRTTTT